MNGATAEPSVSTISTESRSIVITIGPNHHFLRTFMKAQSSPKIDMRPLFACAIHLLLISPSNRCIAELGRLRWVSVERVEFTPIDVLAQRGLVLLAQDLIAEHQRVHLRAHEAE